MEASSLSILGANGAATAGGTERLRIDNAGNVGIGPGITAVSTSGNLYEGSVGSILRFRVRNDGQVRSDVGFTTPAADFAELMEVDQSDSANVESLQPGDVLIISRETGKLKKSIQPYSTLVAGVYSTKPGFLGNQGITDENTGDAVPVALVGVVPTKVTAENGAIRAGDLLTTSSTPGFAMKASPVIIKGVKVYPTGAILGKALEPLKKGKSVINVLVMLR